MFIGLEGNELMDMNEYQDQARETALTSTFSPFYAALGLAGETGELVDQIKKAWRDDDKIITEDRKVKILHEAGDVLWYLARLCDECGLTLNQVAHANRSKLQRRFDEGRIGGQGSDR